LRGIVREVMRTYQATTADLHVELKSELGDEPAMVLGDPDRLKQLVHNLLGNAVEALSAAPERVATLRIRKRGSDVELSLRDTGPGIVDPISIFSPGFTTKPSGTGMGLAISQQIARQHGGRLVARALDAGGSEFTLTLSQMDLERESRPPPSMQ
jgi:signal transduction histidine kinase